MGAQQAFTVMKIITEQKYRRMGKEPPMEEIEKLREEIMRKYEEEGSAYYSTARLWDDGIIDPKDTREVLAFLLSRPIPPYEETPWPVFRF